VPELWRYPDPWFVARPVERGFGVRIAKRRELHCISLTCTRIGHRFWPKAKVALSEGGETLGRDPLWVLSIFASEVRGGYVVFELYSEAQ